MSWVRGEMGYVCSLHCVRLREGRIHGLEEVIVVFVIDCD